MRPAAPVDRISLRSSDQSSVTPHTPSSEPGSQRTPSCSPAATINAPLSLSSATTSDSAAAWSGFVVPRLRLTMSARSRSARRQAATSAAPVAASSRSNTLMTKISAAGAFSRIDGGHRGAVAKPIDVVIVLRSVGVDADATGDAADVRMGCVHAAVDHGDATTRGGDHPLTPAGRSISNSRANAADRSASSRGMPCIDDARAVEHDDVIGGHRHFAAMRDQNRRAAAHHRARAVDDLALRDRIERRGRFIHARARRDRRGTRAPARCAAARPPTPPARARRPSSRIRPAGPG